MLISTFEVNDLKRVELLPFINNELLNPLLLIDNNENLQFYPEISNKYYPPYPVYVMFLKNNGKIRGTFVDFNNKKLIELWRSKLGFISEHEKIIRVAAKPINRKLYFVINFFNLVK